MSDKLDKEEKELLESLVWKWGSDKFKVKFCHYSAT